ncbi:MAG: DUF805 domain-containing protein [Alphaproteobacteria bacterium]|nr:DUF805 domain-containing protein [Alphaproteobacteria bacterium]
MAKENRTKNEISEKKVSDLRKVKACKRGASKSNNKMKKEDCVKSDEKVLECSFAEGKKVSESFSADMFFKFFFEGWKKCFTLKGRASKIELWCFLLVNGVLATIVQLHASYFLSSSFLRRANMRGMALEQIDQYVSWAGILFWGSLLLPIFPIVALLVRRMHDLGKLAWHGYLEQVFMGGVVLNMLWVAIEELDGTNLEYTILAMAVCFVTIFYSVLYYGMKFLLTALFRDGDICDNEYGKAMYVGKFYDELSLKFCVFLLLFLFTVGMLCLGNWYF